MQACLLSLQGKMGGKELETAGIENASKEFSIRDSGEMG